MTNIIFISLKLAALDGLEAGKDEVLADALTQQVRQGLTAPRPVYLSPLAQ